MIKWFKARSLSEKIMLGSIIMLLVGVYLRRDLIKKQGGEAIRNRIELIRNPD